MTLRRIQPGVGPNPPLVILFLVGSSLDPEIKQTLGPRPCIIADDSAHGSEAMSGLLAYAAGARAVEPHEGFAKIYVVGYSMGMQRVRALLRNGVDSDRIDGVIAIDGTHASLPPEPWQIEVWRDLAERARRDEILFVATHTYQTYVEHLRSPFIPYLSTVSALRRALGLDLEHGGPVDAPVEHHDHGLHVYSYDSRDIDKLAHALQQTAVLPTMLRRHVYPEVNNLGPVDEEATPTTPRDPSVAQAPPSILSPFRKAIVDRARGEIGVREKPVNVVPYAPKTVRAHAWIDVQGQAWCCRFACDIVWSSFFASLSGSEMAEQAIAWSALDRGADEPPFTLRAAVWELVADALATGTFYDVERGYEPVAGDLICYGRDGQDPRRRGNLGHVAIDIGGGRAVSGNLDDQVEEHGHDLSARGLPTVGWIRVE